MWMMGDSGHENHVRGCFLGKIPPLSAPAIRSWKLTQYRGKAVILLEDPVHISVLTLSFSNLWKLHYLTNPVSSNVWMTELMTHSFLNHKLENTGEWASASLPHQRHWISSVEIGSEPAYGLASSAFLYPLYSLTNTRIIFPQLPALVSWPVKWDTI